MENLKEMLEKYNGYKFVGAIVLNDGTVKITLVEFQFDPDESEIFPKEVQISFIPSITTGGTGNLRLGYYTRIVED